MATITLMPDGMLRIIGKEPSPELLEEIKHRIGPNEAAVVVTKEEMVAFLERMTARDDPA